MKILLTGKNGQVGYELERALQGLGEIIAMDRSQMDLTNLDQIRETIRQVKPDLIINPAAYTAVDKAEGEPELAMRVNADAPRVMAEEGARLGASFIHYSTDYVFDGSKPSAYVEDDIPCPLNEYGRSKLAGERAIQAVGLPHYIFRTSWVYGARGKNFMQTILRLASEREELRIVADQFGAPTWSRTIAETTAHIIAKCGSKVEKMADLSGIYHLTSQGSTSWCEFAGSILENAGMKNTKIIPISTSDFPTQAERPKNSRLSCERIKEFLFDMPAWDAALRLCQK